MRPWGIGKPGFHTTRRLRSSWFFLRAGDVARAEKELFPLIERNNHQSGRSLANFLHGASLIFRGRADEARHEFARLPAARWPRTWTLGSHHALGRLGGGDLRAYLDGAFPWERKHLRSQVQLLVQGGQPEDPLLRSLT